MAGRGRGKLLDQLKNLNLAEDDSGLAASKGTSEEQKKTDSSANSECFQIQNANVAPTRGRGLLFTKETTESGISGAKISDVASSISHEVDSVDLKPRGRGRGRLLANLKNGKDNDTIETSAVSERIEEVYCVAPTVEETGSDNDVETCVFRGEKGTLARVAVNYIRLKTDPEKGVFEYEVKFKPEVITSSLRYKLVNQMREVIGQAKTFDGVTLYLPIKLKQKQTVGQCEDRDGTKYEVTVIFKKQKKLRDCIHLYNVLFDRVMKTLKYLRYNRKQFDPSKPMLIPQHKLEIWPGYVTAVDEYESGLMLCLDVSFRVLNTRTVLDVLNETYNSNKDRYKSEFEKAVLGQTILTRYNNKTYRIDEVLWDLNPQSTFESVKGGEMRYTDYYKNVYDIQIRDTKQPLLMHIETKRISGKVDPVEMKLCFIPELSNITGLSDAMRSDFKIMKDVAGYTRITPNQRIASLRTFLRSVEESEEAKR